MHDFVVDVPNPLLNISGKACISCFIRKSFEDITEGFLDLAGFGISQRDENLDDVDQVMSKFLCRNYGMIVLLSVF